MSIVFHTPDETSLKRGNYTENMVVDCIEQFPFALGIGKNSKFIKREKYTNNGRLDFIIQSGKNVRYICEVQRDELNGDHIKRLTDYLNSERKENPKYTYKMVFIAESFYKSKAFLNDYIADKQQFTAIQVKIIKVDKKPYITFFPFVKNYHRNISNKKDTYDKYYWLTRKTTQEALQGIDWIINNLTNIGNHRQLFSTIEPNYTEDYIGAKIDGKVDINLIGFEPDMAGKILIRGNNLCGKYCKVPPTSVMKILSQQNNKYIEELTSGDEQHNGILLSPSFLECDNAKAILNTVLCEMCSLYKERKIHKKYKTRGITSPL